MAAKAVQTYQLFTTATTDAAAQLDIPEDGDIVAIHGEMVASDLDTDADRIEAELSFLSTSQFTTNDARGSIAALRLMGTVETLVGVATPRAALDIALGDGIPVAAGERLYIHVSASAGVNPRISFHVYIAHRAVTRRRGRLR